MPRFARTCGCRFAVVVRGAGGRDAAAELVGVEHHDWQGRLPPRARHQPVGAVSGGVCIFGRGRWRIDHRPGVGWARVDRRERQYHRRVGALQGSDATGLGGNRSRAAVAGADAPEHLRRHGAARERAGAALSADFVFRGIAAARQMPLQRRYERFPYVPSDPATRDERCAEYSTSRCRA